MAAARDLILDEQIVNRLSGFVGDKIEDKILYLAREVVMAKLRECNERITGFEFRYGMPFIQFDAAWDQDQIADRHSYSVETDYIEWEALEMEKRHWLAMARDLSPASPQELMSA
jgi:hypothetical protein